MTTALNKIIQGNHSALIALITFKERAKVTGHVPGIGVGMGGKEFFFNFEMGATLIFLRDFWVSIPFEIKFCIKEGF